jgi:hypothetical protein
VQLSRDIELKFRNCVEPFFGISALTQPALCLVITERQCLQQGGCRLGLRPALIVPSPFSNKDNNKCPSRAGPESLVGTRGGTVWIPRRNTTRVLDPRFDLATRSFDICRGRGRIAFSNAMGKIDSGQRNGPGLWGLSGRHGFDHAVVRSVL